MIKATATGRPALRRDKVAGRNLCSALKVLGKHWRRDTESSSHIRNWTNWTDCELPSSPTTIDRDMREGIPEHRIAAYALCLGLSPTELCSPRTDLVTALTASQASSDKGDSTVAPAHLPHYSERFRRYNDPSYIRDLYALMGGVYRMDYLLQGIDLVHRCTLWVYAAEAHYLRMRGRFIMFGNENPLEAVIFRWHSNLHTHFLCENGTELGYTLSVDPLRFDQVRQRRPFWIRGTGMTDRGLEDHQPITFTFRMNQLPLPRGMTAEQFWQQESRDMEKRPFRSPGEQGHDAIWTDITTPEKLL